MIRSPAYTAHPHRQQAQQSLVEGVQGGVGGYLGRAGRVKEPAWWNMGVSGRGKALGSGTSGMALGVIGLRTWTPPVSRDRVRLVDRRPLKGVVRQKESLGLGCFEHIHSGKLIGLKTWTPRVSRDRVYRRDASSPPSHRSGGSSHTDNMRPTQQIQRETGSTSWFRDCDEFVRRQVVSKPLRGHGTWLASSRWRAPTGQGDRPARSPIDALRAVQQWFPGPKIGLVVFRHSVISVHRLLCFRLRP